MKVKSILTTLIFAATVFTVSAKEDKLRQAMRAADGIVWAGLDYSLMKMIGSSNAIKAPDLLFHDMPAKWNDLFLDERIEGVAMSLEKIIHIDIAGVTERNRQLSPSQVELNNQAKDIIKESHISLKDIADAVQSIKLNRKEGLGLMFLVDRMVSERKLQATPSKIHKDAPPAYISRAGAAYVVFFDIATREVFSARREAWPVGTGGSFRNFWFGPIKDIDSQLSQYRE
jgi:hypothetical protein